MVSPPEGTAPARKKKEKKEGLEKKEQDTAPLRKKKKEVHLSLYEGTC